MKKKILVSITTITGSLHLSYLKNNISDWRTKIKEIDRLGLKEVAIFPTCLNKKQRQIFYRQLEKTSLKAIPFVHLREQDFDATEIKYLVNRWHTKVFNCHATNNTEKFIRKNWQYRKKIYIENTVNIDDNYLQVLKLSAGVCLDTAHWEDFGIKQKTLGYANFAKIIEKDKIGCCHVSVMQANEVKEYSVLEKKMVVNYSCHYMRKLSQLDYVKKYKKYLRGYIAIELENSLAEQLKVKKYLEKIIG